MATQDKTLSGSEHDYFATRSGLASNAPLTEHKAKVFSDAGYGGVGKPLSQMEREWLQAQANSSKINEGDLWMEAVARTGTPATRSTSQNKFLFYNTSLSLTDYIKSLSGLQAYYPFDEPSGDAINHAPATIGTLDGTITGATQGVEGLMGDAYSFDGTDDKVTFPEVEFTSSSKISIVALIKPSSIAAIHTIMCKRTAGNSTFMFRVGDASGDGKLTWVWMAGGVNQSYQGAQPTVAADTDVLVGVSFDYANPGSVNFYKNGVKTTIARNFGAGVNPQDTNVGLTAGATADDAFDYAGLMQHVARFDVALGDDEHLRIAQLAGLA